MMMPVSVVVCSRNRPRLLADTVASILSGDDVPSEVVVIDQSADPTDLTVDVPRPPECLVRHVRSQERGLSRARNHGAALAAHDVVVFVDDDMKADPGWLRALVDPLLREGGPLVATGRVLPGPQEAPGGFVPAVVERATPEEFHGRLDRDVLAGGNMALYRAALVETGGFDPRLGPGSEFPAAEDNDLGYRLLEAGYRIRYVPAALLYHRAWRPANEYLPLRYAYGRGQGAYYAKHVNAHDRHFLRRLGADLMRRLARASRRALRLELRRAAGEVAHGVGLLVGAARWWVRGRRPLPSPASWNGNVH